MTKDDYTAVRCGMNVSKGIIEGTIDAGIGLENIQQVEVCVVLMRSTYSRRLITFDCFSASTPNHSWKSGARPTAALQLTSRCYGLMN